VNDLSLDRSRLLVSRVGRRAVRETKSSPDRTTPASAISPARCSRRWPREIPGAGSSWPGCGEWERMVSPRRGAPTPTACWDWASHAHAGLCW